MLPQEKSLELQIAFYCILCVVVAFMFQFQSSNKTACVTLPEELCIMDGFLVSDVFLVPPASVTAEFDPV